MFCRAQTLERIESDLTEANLALCQSRSENDKLLLKLEKMQDKAVQLKKHNKKTKEEIKARKANQCACATLKRGRARSDGAALIVGANY